MRYVVLFGRFWYDFIVGDDWKIAAGVTAALAGGAVLVAVDALPDSALTVLVGCAIALVVVASVVSGALSRR
jgi:hypothetical protein